jgi:hypothetical protein
MLISVLIGAIETVLGGTAYGIGPGYLQIFVVVSMVGAFAIVIGLFFYVLIKYPGHFYNPGEYPKWIMPFSGKERDMTKADPRGEAKPQSPSS